MLAIATSAALLTGCQNTHGINTDLAISSGLNAYKAATLSDADAKAIANQGCVEMDSGNKVASKSSKYGKRLAKIAKALGNNINGTPVNYKVYMTSDVNAWAMANGCVRVYSGLMDMMNPGTYVRPHRHPHTFELLLPLRGRFVVLNFDDRGTVTHRAILGETCTVLEMAAGTWHAVLSLDTGGIIFEVKHGGYQPVAADDYAHWAPAEGEPGTTELMAWYAQAQVGDSTFAV